MTQTIIFVFVCLVCGTKIYINKKIDKCPECDGELEEEK